MRVDLPRSRDAHAYFRTLVEAGLPDQPVELHHDGKHCLTYRSLHRAALLTVSEEPRCRFTPWSPYPGTQAGPRIQALLDARAATPKPARKRRAA
ncbi:hypothetical protein [Roseomonas chloroacetimidivorans]|uniref:hypothetical protein n=1 Tax=Roseomonas chloroacetimidivorans TaxID=1766656 RepID=UPI003C753C76